MPDRKLKPVAGMIDTPPMRPALRQFVDWVAGYTLSPPGEVMAMALRVVAPGIGPPATGWRRADPLPEARITEARQQGAGRAGRTEPRGTGELARAAGVGAGVVRGMADAGLLVPAVLPVAAAVRHPRPGASRRGPGARSGSRRRRAAAGGGGARLLASRCWTA